MEPLTVITPDDVIRAGACRAGVISAWPEGVGAIAVDDALALAGVDQVRWVRRAASLDGGGYSSGDVAVGYGYGDGSSSGDYGYDYGYGSGDGYGGDCDGYGYGYGDGDCDGDGYGSGGYGGYGDGDCDGVSTTEER